MPRHPKTIEISVYYGEKGNIENIIAPDLHALNHASKSFADKIIAALAQGSDVFDWKTSYSDIITAKYRKVEDKIIASNIKSAVWRTIRYEKYHG